MKKIAIYIIATVALLAANAQTPDAQYKLLRHQYTTYGDSAMDINIRKEIKLFRNRAITAYALNGESFIVYNPDFEELVINECYTLRPNGERVYPRPSAFVEQLPSSCTNCGRLNHIKEMAIVHTGLEPNCTVVLDYTIHRKSTTYFEAINMQQAYPVDLYEIIVNGQTLSSTRNIPQNDNIYQAFAPAEKKYRYDIILGTQPVFNCENRLPEADQLLKKLKTNDNVTTVKNICNWIKSNINYNPGLDLSHVDYQIAPAREVYLTNCGTPADCIGLAAALLNQAGIAASIHYDTLSGDISHNIKLEIQLGSVSYLVNPLSNFELTPQGIAIDMVKTISIDSTLSWCGTEIADGYYTIELPKHHGSNALNPVLLTPSRKAPVQVTPCDESYHYVVELPKRVKLMGDEVNISYKKEGVGSIEIKVIQKSKKLDITRRLTIDTPLIDEAHYADFRQLMTDWNSYQSFIVR